VLDAAGAEPLVELRDGPLVGEVGAPEGRVLDARLREARSEVQEPDETGEVAGPVRDHEDRSAVGAQAREHVVAVLPDRLDDDERGIRRQRLEHLDARALAVDEAVSGHRVDAPWPRSTDLPSRSTAAAKSASSPCCVGQHFTLPEA
jgi:hypothetical protein